MISLMSTVNLTADGLLPLPLFIREAFGLTPGSQAMVEACGDHLEIKPLPQQAATSKSSASGRGLLKGMNVDFVRDGGDRL